MLTLTREENDSLFIEPFEDIDPNMTVAELFADGGIDVFISNIQGKQIKIGIEAPKALNIVRGELIDCSAQDIPRWSSMLSD